MFLDEIGELPMAMQVKLLRVLEERQVLRVGGAQAARRSTCASSPRPTAISSSEIARGAFRQDLFFRLNGVTLHIPPLRERVEEIEDLAHEFIEQVAKQQGRARRRSSGRVCSS